MAGQFFLILALVITSVLSQEKQKNEDENWKNMVPGEYMVTLSDDTEQVETLESLISQYSPTITTGELSTKIRSVIGSRQYFTVKTSEENADKLRSMPGVELVEENMRAFPMGFRVSGISDDILLEPVVGAVCSTQDASNLWGLDRIDQTAKTPGSDPMEYIYGASSGTGQYVDVYVVDTGVDVDHPEFGGRAVHGYTAPDMEDDFDNDGHGTHVSGTIGAATYGVAKQANIIAVKVLGPDGGSTSGIVAAFDWIGKEYEARGRRNSVINLSLGYSSISTTFESALQLLIDDGITAVAAAGNSYEDACLSSAGHQRDAVIVGASTVDDAPASFSNWGTCLDLWAPGHEILSITTNGTLEYWSGTSMAAPHVTGVVARYLSYMTLANQKPTPAEVAHWLDIMTTRYAIEYRNSFEGSSPNKLLFIDCASEWTTPFPATERSRGSFVARLPRAGYMFILITFLIFVIY